MGSSTESLGYSELPESFQNLGDQAANYLSGLLGDTSTSNQLTSSLSNLSLGNLKGGSDYISSVLGGDYLDFESNEALQSAASGLTNDYNEGVTSSINDLNRQAQSAGQFFSGASSAANIAATDKLAEDYLGELGDLYSESYNTERGLQQSTLDSLLGATTDAISGENLGIENVSNLISAGTGGSSLSSGFGLK